ncbi:hypothetical protein DYQ86_16330 [Acidobacteria bacterium AB60]|nr:hypothetical protein DYQ86_16330 [Acidobacteria bacterium AB60]
MAKNEVPIYRVYAAQPIYVEAFVPEQAYVRFSDHRAALQEAEDRFNRRNADFIQLECRYEAQEQKHKSALVAARRAALEEASRVTCEWCRDGHNAFYENGVWFHHVPTREPSYEPCLAAEIRSIIASLEPPSVRRE